jgi:hypothetical protein
MKIKISMLILLGINFLFALLIFVIPVQSMQWVESFFSDLGNFTPSNVSTEQLKTNPIRITGPVEGSALKLPQKD